LAAAAETTSFPKGGGELGSLIRRFDWAATSLGSIETWPQSLKTTTGMLLMSPVPIVLLWGTDGVMLYNDAYSVFAGGRHPSLLGSNVREGWAEVADFNDNVMRVGLAGGTLAYKDQELTLNRHGRPEQVWMNLDYSPVLDEAGRPAGVIAFVVETTERVRAERLLTASEDRLRFLDALGKATAQSGDADSIMATTTRMVGEHLGVSICAYADMDDDADGFTIRGDWTAPGTHSIKGRYSLTDFGSRAVRTLHAGEPLVLRDNRAELDPRAAATFLGIGLAATICLPFIKDGKLSALMAIHDKAPRQWSERELSLLTEVTQRSWAHVERVRSEEAVRASERRFREQLEVEVAERTQALRQSEQALLHVQKMEAIGSLTGGIAHDFNNLLMAISGSLELLRKRMPEQQNLQRLLDNAMQATQRGRSLTQRMLAFARRQELRSERVNLGHLVAEMTELLRRSIGPTITVQADFPKRLPLVQADPNQLETALLNLAVNARDAMEESGVLIFSAREETVDEMRDGLQPGHYVCLSVIDTGAGMDETVLKRAAEPFFTTKGVGKGTGLGLSMVHGFAEQSGGALLLRSAPRLGTTAEIWLPAYAVSSEAGETESAADARAIVAVRETTEPNDVGRSPLAILVVDDDALVLMNTVEMLEDLGHSVASAQSGSEAISLLRDRRFDVLVTDHAMPMMTGAQLATEVRARGLGLPIILATGYADLPSGTPDLPRLTKPFSQSELADLVQRVASMA
jgi:PAS domain S-box-containing protein